MQYLEVAAIVILQSLFCVSLLVFLGLSQKSLNQSRAVVIHFLVGDDRFSINWKTLRHLCSRRSYYKLPAGRCAVRVQSNKQGVVGELLDYTLASHISPMMPIDTTRLHTWSSCLACAGAQPDKDEPRLVRWNSGSDGGLFGRCWCCADECVNTVVGIASVSERGEL